MKSHNFFYLLIIGIIFTACNNNSSSNAEKTNDSLQNAEKKASLKEDEVSYSADNTNLKAYVVYDNNLTGKRPAVLVVHEWWGMNDYPKMRARKLAELGYVAMAVDLFGNGKTVDNSKDASQLATPFYQDPEMTKRRLEVFISNLKKYPEVDTTKIAAIGYCFGGGVLLNTARLGENLAGVVSFHGSLLGTPAKKELLRTKLLVCHGDSDQFVSQKDVQQFKKQMDSIGADYEFKHYPGATHAFTNPAATETGK
jgi:dienelactone hydrolase